MTPQELIDAQRAEIVRSHTAEFEAFEEALPYVPLVEKVAAKFPENLDTNYLYTVDEHVAVNYQISYNQIYIYYRVDSFYELMDAITYMEQVFGECNYSGDRPEQYCRVYHFPHHIVLQAYLNTDSNKCKRVEVGTKPVYKFKCEGLGA